MKKIYVLSGPSGAGASTAKYVFEELGYYIIENFPFEITDDLLDKVLNKEKINNICLITPIFNANKVVDKINKHPDFSCSLILLDCEKQELLQRYVLSRHIHPMAITKKISLEEAIDADIIECKKLIPKSDIYIDTTKGNIKELRTTLYNHLNAIKEGHLTTIRFISFGMKHGMQKDVDMIIDCRNLPNPYWVESLKELTGLDPEVVSYMNSFEETDIFLQKTIEYLNYVFEEVSKNGRGYYTVGVCCSGGHHRSPFIADYLCSYYSTKYKTLVRHRDCPELNKE